MKLQVNITDITHDDLVDFLSTALTGSAFWGVDYNTEEYNALPNKKDDDCFEDCMARLLLAGKSVTIFDMYAEDEDDYYGTLPHKWNDEDTYMEYSVTLEDIKSGICKCLDGTFEINKGCEEEIPYIKKCATNLINNQEDMELDLPQASNILQVCVFGKLIYG